MNRINSVLALSCFGIACTSARAEEPRASSPPGPGYHGVVIATQAGAGPAKEVKVLLETPHLKLATITLRQGTILEEHSTPMPVTIQALRGAGVVRMGDAREAVSVGRMVVLAPGVAHSVAPDGADDLVLLVHHMKSPGRQGKGSGRGPGRGAE